MGRKRKQFTILISVFLVSIAFLTVGPKEDSSSSNEKKFVDELGVSSSGVKTMCYYDIFWFHGWSKLGDSITYDFSTSPSSNIEVWALDENQVQEFMKTHVLPGVRLIRDSSASDVFYPQYESKWNIFFVKNSFGCIDVSYTVDFSPSLIITKPISSTSILTESDLLVE